MAGGALGAGLRHLVGQALLRQPGAGAFPWATLLVNLAGAFVAGFLLLWLEGRAGPGRRCGARCWWSPWWAD